MIEIIHWQTHSHPPLPKTDFISLRIYFHFLFQKLWGIFVIICISKIIITMTCYIEPISKFCSWFSTDRMTPYRVISTSTQKHASFIQEGENLCGSRVSLKTSHTRGIGYWPDPDLSRHRARAHHGWGGEGQTSHWWLVTTQGLRRGTQNHIHAIFQMFWHSSFCLYICVQYATLNLFKKVFSFIPKTNEELMWMLS